MDVAGLADRLDARFPFANAASWDPVGIQLGWPTSHAGKVAVCHEVTEEIVAWCRERAIETLVSYHPLLFHPTTSLVAGPTPEGRALQLNRAGVSLIVVHTALDAATPGSGDALLDALDLPTERIERWAYEDPEGRQAFGRVALLESALPGGRIAAMVRDSLESDVRTTSTATEVWRVAVLPGSGAAHVASAAAIADVLITGDVNHHTASEAKALGLMVIDAGHAATERPAIAALYAAVCEEVGDAIHLEDDPTPWEA